MGRMLRVLVPTGVFSVIVGGGVIEFRVLDGEVC